MKVFIYILLFSVCCMFISEAQGQRILLVQRTARFKNYKYFVGDDIAVRTSTHSKRISGTIEKITDTTILIDFDKEIFISDIRKIYRHRYWFGLLSKVTRIAGAGYFALDATNNIINGNPTIVSNNTLITSASIVGFSYALVPFHYKRLRVGKAWRLLVLNMSMDIEVPNPFLR
ncbi:MAG TPA: hypothetical protein VK994_03875 [Bacteroidales bacterium]|nr:hypothetical protein [Bacteroidales bacterium]